MNVITKETDFNRWYEEMRDTIETKILLVCKDKEKVSKLLEKLLAVCDEF